MAILKARDILKINETEMDEKIKELKIELVKAKIAGQKSSKLNQREIRRTIAKLLTFKKFNESSKKQKNSKISKKEGKK